MHINRDKLAGADAVRYVYLSIAARVVVNFAPGIATGSGPDALGQDRQALDLFLEAVP